MTTFDQLLSVCQTSGRRPFAISSGNSFVIATAGMEGRLFYGRNGLVSSLFRPEAATHFSNSANGYFNPGGDGLWPAPEGTAFGYEYSTGQWRVPMGLCNAQYEILEQKQSSLSMAAEIDLVNARQLGIPTRFRRDVTVREENGVTIIDQRDSIEYIGTRPLGQDVFLLAPWSLSQFVVTPDSRAFFKTLNVPIRDLYHSSGHLLHPQGDARTEMRPDSENRIQIALPEEAAFVELTLPQQGLCVKRTVAPMPPPLIGADIADAPVDSLPESPVRFSIYNDPSGFIELETVGGSQFPLTPGTVLTLETCTTIAPLEG